MTLRIHRDSRYIYKKLSRNLLAITVYYLGKMGNPSAFIWNLRFIGNLGVHMEFLRIHETSDPVVSLELIVELQK